MREQRRYAFDVRAAEPAGDGKLRWEGYAAVFDSEIDFGPFREVIRKGAFRKTLRESDQVALWDHESRLVLGRRSENTLELTEDEHGLKASGVLDPEVGHQRDVYHMLRRGDIKGMSFGFNVTKEQWSTRDDGTELREIKEVRLYEVSPVTFPAYEATEVEARAIYEAHRATTEEPVQADHSAAGAERKRLIRLRKETQNRRSGHGQTQRTA